MGITWIRVYFGDGTDRICHNYNWEGKRECQDFWLEQLEGWFCYLQKQGELEQICKRNKIHCYGMLKFTFKWTMKVMRVQNHAFKCPLEQFG